MSQYPRMRIITFQLTEQVEQRTFLCQRTRICHTPMLVEPAFIADAEAALIPSGSMSPDMVGRTADMHFAIARDIKVITYIRKTSGKMAPAE